MSAFAALEGAVKERSERSDVLATRALLHFLGCDALGLSAKTIQQLRALFAGSQVQDALGHWVGPLAALGLGDLLKHELDSLAVGKKRVDHLALVTAPALGLDNVQGHEKSGYRAFRGLIAPM